LKDELKRRDVARVSLFGWSQGAFLACDFARKNPQLVERLILVSPRKRYERKELSRVKEFIKKGKDAYLYSFYKACFSKDETEAFGRFRKALLKSYLAGFDEARLLAQLDWLAGAAIEGDSLKGVGRLSIFHGKADSVAPVEEAVDIAKRLPQARLVLFEGAGHLPFLRPDFGDYLKDERDDKEELLEAR
jgi:pimeloyl-ACP methyl ester carboxylesterase